MMSKKAKSKPIKYVELYKEKNEVEDSQNEQLLPDNVSVHSVSSRLTKMSKSIRQVDESEILAQFGIKPSDGLKLWPFYFNMVAPSFDKKTYRQILSFKFLENLLIDHKTGAIPYLSWKQDTKDRTLKQFQFDLKKVGFVQNFSKNFINNNINEKYLQLFELLDDIPEDVLGGLSIAIDIYYNKILRPSTKETENFKETRIELKLEGYGPEMRISELSSKEIGRLVKIRGEVAKIESKKILVKKVEYICNECGEKQEIFLKDGIITKPSECPSAECPNKFAFILNKQKSQCGIFQRICLTNTETNNLSRNVNTISEIIVEVRDNAFKNFKLSQQLSITGILKTEISQNAKNLRKMKNAGFFDTYLLANNIQELHQKSMKFNLNGLPKFRKMLLHNLMSNDLILPILLKSFAPGIYGQFMAKTSLLLTLLGGSNPETIYKKHFGSSAEAINQKVIQDLGFRENIHCLILGEPGNGMNVLLEFCQKLFPESKIKLILASYHNSRESKISELFCQVVSENRNNYQIIPGKLPIAHRSFCIIDHLEMADKAFPGILEVMERKKLTILEKSIYEELRANVGVIASAHPKSKKIK